MANYRCAIRTNYFRVKNEEAFRELMECVVTDEDNVELWEQYQDEEPTFGFGAYGTILGLPDEEEYSYDKFILELQKCVADDDAIIIFEVGNEKLRYLVGYATIITSTKVECISIDNMAIATARGMLTDPLWETQCDY